MNLNATDLQFEIAGREVFLKRLREQGAIVDSRLRFGEKTALES